jgi:hypothetical protein
MPMAGLINFCGLWTAVMISDVCNSYQLKRVDLQQSARFLIMVIISHSTAIVTIWVVQIADVTCHNT